MFSKIPQRPNILNRKCVFKGCDTLTSHFTLNTNIQRKQNIYIELLQWTVWLSCMEIREIQSTMYPFFVCGGVDEFTGEYISQEFPKY